MTDTCGDNRFELIEKYKQKLIESTNIEDSKEEMAVIDDILFRFWQMGWLDNIEESMKYMRAWDKVIKLIEEQGRIAREWNCDTDLGVAIRIINECLSEANNR